MSSTTDNTGSPSKAREARARAEEALRQAGQVGDVDKIKKDLRSKELGTIEGQIGQAIESVGIVARVIANVVGTARWIKSDFIDPIMEVPYIGKAFKTVDHLFREGLHRFTHPYKGESFKQAVKNSLTYPYRRSRHELENLFKKDKKPFEPVPREREEFFSRPRAGVVSLMAAWALTAVAGVPIVGDTFNYVVTEPLVDIPRMTWTAAFNGVTGHGFGLTHDTLYFSAPIANGVHEFHIPASDEKNSNENNSYSFVVRDRLAHELWSWAHGHGPFQPKLVVAPIRADSNKCETISYGSRFKLFRWASFEPDILTISCGSSAPDAPPPPSTSAHTHHATPAPGGP